MESKKKILVIEDDKFLGELLMNKFHKEKLTAVLAFEGEDGLRQAREDKPDLIILDIILPGIDGFEVLKVLKSDSELYSIPVIMLSNLGHKGEIQSALKLGAKEFMIKADMNLDEIVERIRKILQKL